MSDLRAWFNSVDTDRSNCIDARELQQALAAGRLDFPLHTCAMMIRMYDKNRSGTVNYEEFVALHQFIMSVQNSFIHFDIDRSGTLEPNETLQALRFNGYQLEQQAFHALFQSFDPNRSGKLRLDEFISMAAFLSSAKNVFAAFDFQRTGSITVNLNQFIYAAAHLR